MGLPKFPVNKVLILVAILALPGFLYYLLQEKGKNRYKPPGIFGPKTVAASFHVKRGKRIPDTIYHRIRGFKLLNQDNKVYTFPAPGKITVASFFFTRCPGPCRVMNRELQRVVTEYQTNRRIGFISISADPEFDSPGMLKKYAAGYHKGQGDWNFLTGDRQLIYRLAKEDFLVDVLEDPAAPYIIHSQMLMLIDPGSRIRGYYDSSDSKQVDVLSDEIKVLIAEELRKIKVE